jgi:penicillin-binding protein 2
MTRRAGTARSTCTSRSFSPATPTTTCWPTTWGSTPSRASWAAGFGQRTGVDIEGESEGVLPSPEWKKRRFKRPGAAEVVCRRNDLDRHRPGLQFLHADPAGAGDGHHRQQRRHVPPAPRQVHHRQPQRRADDDRAGAAARLPWKRQHVETIKKAMIGVNTQGTGARAFAGAGYTSAGKTGTAQVFSLKGYLQGVGGEEGVA